MWKTLVVIVALSIVASARSAWAQTPSADSAPHACVRIQETHDSLAAPERAADQRVFGACGSGQVFAMPPHRNRADVFGYARLGYARLLAGRSYGTPALGAGFRVELESVAFDVSFLNVQTNLVGIGSVSGPDAPTHTLSGSVIKLEALKFVRAESTSSAYLGAGFSAGVTEISGLRTQERGSGIQGEFTTGIEFLRDTPTRAFIQADVIVPFYRATAAPLAPPTFSSHYTPSIAISVGIGAHLPRHRYAQLPPRPPMPPRLPVPPRFPWRLPPV